VAEYVLDTGAHLQAGRVGRFLASGPKIAVIGLIASGFVTFLGGAVSFLSAAITRWTTEIAVTNQRVILKRGLIKRDTIEIQHTLG
jgi:hypothetical protein